MKNSKLYSLILIFAAALLCVQCTTDPIPGPAGEDGIDGIDGVDGVDGVNGTTECAQCHNVAKSEAVHASFIKSFHSGIPNEDNNSWGRGTSSSCSQCHNGQGFADYAEFGIAGSYDTSGPLTCSSCHDKHSSFDFDTDGKDYALRYLRPVTLMTDETYTIDYDDKPSNTCAACHQPRRTLVDDGSGFVAVSGHWGPHHGPQSTLLEGIQGEELAGRVDYPDPGSAAHRKGSSCTACHMDEPSGTDNGYHTWVPSYSTACTECHNDAPEEVEGFAEDMETLLAQLEDIGILHSEVVDGHLEVHPIEGDWPLLEARAAWNYLLIYEDSSNGIHNPKYAKALIQNSIEALNNAD